MTARQIAIGGKMDHPLSSLIDQIVQNAEKRGDFEA